MIYDPKYLIPLIDQLDGHYKDLKTQIHNLEAAAGKMINVAWEDNESAEGFRTAHTNWETEFADTADILEALRDAVDRALGNAQSADKKVYDSFAGM
ncbi:WXG100 family type VII secretion target [Nocardia sp. X0981]